MRECPKPVAQVRILQRWTKVKLQWLLITAARSRGKCRWDNTWSKTPRGSSSSCLPCAAPLALLKSGEEDSDEIIIGLGYG